MLAICVEIDHEVAIQIVNGEFEPFGKRSPKTSLRPPDVVNTDPPFPPTALDNFLKCQVLAVIDYQDRELMSELLEISDRFDDLF
jgi:hypothetical protein